jgi:hypothetical protein
MNTAIHPDLRREALLVTLVGIGIVVAGMAAFGITIFFTWHGIVNQTLSRMGTAAALVLTGGLLFALVFISRYLLAAHLNSLRQASLILGTAVGEKREMVYTGEKTLTGPVVNLFLPHESSPAAQGEAIKLTIPKWKIPTVGGSSVDFYRSAGSGNRLVVIRTDRHYLFGQSLSEGESHRVIRKQKRLIIGFAALAILFLLAIFAYQLWRTANFYQTYLQAGLSSQWPTAEGKRGYAFVRESERTPGGKKIRGYEAVLSYDYEVAGRPYKGSTLFFGYQGTANRANAEDVVNRYKQSISIRVFYNPANPAISVLEPGHQEALQGQLWGMGILMAFTVLAILVATLICASGLKERGNPSPSSS